MPAVQPDSKLVTWGGYLALTLLLLLPLSVLTVRSGAWQQGLLLYALSCAGAAVLLALFAILLFLPAFRQWRRGIRIRALLVLPGTILLASIVAGRGDYPPIHDISTDTRDPPAFANAPALRGKYANPLTIKPESIGAQRSAYPDVVTLRNRDTLADNFARALRTADELGWEVHHSDPDEGIIEAVDTTAIMAFQDDVVIRLRRRGGETLVDLRSVSRVGVGDLGANARRIRAFGRAFQR